MLVIYYTVSCHLFLFIPPEKKIENLWLYFSGGTKRGQWHKMGLKRLNFECFPKRNHIQCTLDPQKRELNGFSFNQLLNILITLK